MHRSQVGTGECVFAYVVMRATCRRCDYAVGMGASLTHMLMLSVNMSELLDAERQLVWRVAPSVSARTMSRNNHDHCLWADYPMIPYTYPRGDHDNHVEPCDRDRLLSWILTTKTKASADSVGACVIPPYLCSVERVIPKVGFLTLHLDWGVVFLSRTGSVAWLTLAVEP